jgi:hypothetical protein
MPFILIYSPTLQAGKLTVVGFFPVDHAFQLRKGVESIVTMGDNGKPPAAR